MATSNDSSETKAMDILMRLPFDLAVMVIKCLQIKELYTCSLVSHGWRKLFTDPSVLHPILIQVSHFDQEPVLFRHLPDGHGSYGDNKNEDLEDQHLDDKDANGWRDDTPEALRTRLEESTNMQWIKNPQVLLRLLQKTLNREYRWSKGQPTTRLYLPPVPLDGTNADIKEEWQGPVKSVKMKSGIVAALYDKGKTIHLWNLNSHYNRVHEITEQYISDNKELLRAQKKYGGPDLPPFTEPDIEAFLRCSRSGILKTPILSVIRLRRKPEIFDFQIVSNVLVTATVAGEVDVYDMKTGKHLRTLVPSNQTDTVGVVHVWMDFVIVAHGPTVSLWNHRTGEVLEDDLQTTHRAKITGAFVLDNDNHVMTIDETGIIAITDRSAESPQTDTLLDTPMYPIYMVGKAGAPYMMRLLHMSHLCVWGKFGFGHYELFEPGLQNLPPLDTLVLSSPDGAAHPEEEDHHHHQQEDDDAERETGSHSSDEGSDSDWRTAEEDETEEEQGEHEQREEATENGDNPSSSSPSPPPLPSGSDADSETSRILEQLRHTHEDMERMYSHVIGDIDSDHPQGTRSERQALNKVPEESRYHMISIDSPFDRAPVGDILSADFRRSLYLDWNFIQIADLEGNKGEDGGATSAVSFGLYPTEPMVPKYGPGLQPIPPLRYRKGGAVDPEEMAKRRIDRPCTWAPLSRDPAAKMPQPYQDGYDPNIEQHGHLLRMMHGPDGQGVLYDRTTHPRASRSSRTKASDKLPVTLVHLETRIMRYIVILYFHMSHGPPFLRNSCTLEQAEEAREYVARFLPEIFDEVIKGTGLHLLFLLAPYYIQRIFESSLFEGNPVVNVDHRGQAVDVRQVWRDVSRVHSVTDGPYSEMTREYAGDNSAAYYQRNRIMPFSMHGLQQSATAMDDSQVAVGCQNGYIVVVSFD